MIQKIRYGVFVNTKNNKYFLDDVKEVNIDKAYKKMRKLYGNRFYYRTNWEIVPISYNNECDVINHAESLSLIKEYKKRFSEKHKIIKGRRILLQDGRTGIVKWRFDNGLLSVKMDDGQTEMVNVDVKVKRLDFVDNGRIAYGN